MAKIIYVCARNAHNIAGFGVTVEQINARITPDNIAVRPAQVWESDGVGLAVLNATAPLLRNGVSACMGYPIFVPSDWHRVGGGDPDGTYSLFRADHRALELGTDVAGTRTIWYAKTEDLFLASNSQRAIILLLGSFLPNPEVHPWMLSGGFLGPDLSWDQRIHYVPADCHLRLDRSSWQTTLQHREDAAVIERRSRDAHKRCLRNALEEVFDQVHADDWALTLSGGMDSRAILMLLKDRQRVKHITWGTRALQDDRQGDGGVSQELALRTGIDWEYRRIIPGTGKEVLERFVEVGEGRSDELYGYMDGMHIWKDLHEQGLRGILRGDEILGDWVVYSPYMVLSRKHMFPLAIYANLPDLKTLGLTSQTLPPQLKQQPHETLAEWSDRLEQKTYFPANLSGLNELKAGYLEVMNPLISRRVMDTFKTIPARITVNRRLFHEIVDDLCPNMPYALSDSTSSTKCLLQQETWLNPVLDELKEAHPDALPPQFTQYLLDHAHPSGNPKKGSRLAAISYEILSVVPQLSAIRERFPRKVNINLNRLALRAYILARMDRLLKADAQFLRKQFPVQLDQPVDGLVDRISG
jgi:hypothetical protein